LNVDSATCATVRIEPLGVQIQVYPGENVMAAAQRLGYWWPTRCRGMAICTACVLVVEAGAENFSPISDLEADALDALKAKQPNRPSTIRLACQAQPVADAVVFRRGVKKAESLKGAPSTFFV
jgi:2Fe-2S ferredoxin